MNGYPPPAVRLPAIRATVRRTARASRALAGACHPLPTVAVTALVTAVAAAAGRGLPGTTAVALAVLAGQLSVGWANDALDARRDAAVGRTDKPAAAGALTPRVVAVAAVTALVLCVPLSLLSGTRAAAVHLTGVVCGGWAYNLGLKATWWSPLPYAIGFASLPAFVALGLPGHPWPAWWAVLGAALLGVGAHLVNVLPDLADDQATGIAGLPHRIGATWSRRCAAVVLAAAVAVIAFGPPGSGELSPGMPAPVGVGLAVGVAVGGVAWLLLFRQRSSGENVTPSSPASDLSVRTGAEFRTQHSAAPSASPQVRTPTTTIQAGLAAPDTDTANTQTSAIPATPQARAVATRQPAAATPQAITTTTAWTSTHLQSLSGTTPSPATSATPKPRQDTTQAPFPPPAASVLRTATDAPQEAAGLPDHTLDHAHGASEASPRREAAGPPDNTPDHAHGASEASPRREAAGPPDNTPDHAHGASEALPRSVAQATATSPTTDPAAPATPTASDAPTPPPPTDEPSPLGTAARNTGSPARPQHLSSATPTGTTPTGTTPTPGAGLNARRNQLPFRIAIAIAALAVVLLIAHGGQIA